MSGEGGRPFGLDRYGKAFYVAWYYKHRVALGDPAATLRGLAAKEGITGRFAEHIWTVVNRAEHRLSRPARRSSAGGRSRRRPPTSRHRLRRPAPAATTSYKALDDLAELVLRARRSGRRRRRRREPAVVRRRRRSRPSRRTRYTYRLNWASRRTRPRRAVTARALRRCISRSTTLNPSPGGAAGRHLAQPARGARARRPRGRRSAGEPAAGDAARAVPAADPLHAVAALGAAGRRRGASSHSARVPTGPRSAPTISRRRETDVVRDRRARRQATSPSCRRTSSSAQDRNAVVRVMISRPAGRPGARRRPARVFSAIRRAPATERSAPASPSTSRSCRPTRTARPTPPTRTRCRRRSTTPTTAPSTTPS